MQAWGKATMNSGDSRTGGCGDEVAGLTPRAHGRREAAEREEQDSGRALRAPSAGLLGQEPWLCACIYRLSRIKAPSLWETPICGSLFYSNNCFVSCILLTMPPRQHEVLVRWNNCQESNFCKNKLTG